MCENADTCFRGGVSSFNTCLPVCFPDDTQHPPRWDPCCCCLSSLDIRVKSRRHEKPRGPRKREGQRENRPPPQPITHYTLHTPTHAENAHAAVHMVCRVCMHVWYAGEISRSVMQARTKRSMIGAYSQSSRFDLSFLIREQRSRPKATRRYPR